MRRSNACTLRVLIHIFLIRNIHTHKPALQGRNIYITKGTGAGQVGLIRAGPDADRKIVVTGLLGYCSGGVDAEACRGDWFEGDPLCKVGGDL